MNATRNRCAGQGTHPVRPHEVRVLVLLADGLTRAQIAVRVGSTEDAVKTTIRRVRYHYQDRGIDTGTTVLLLRAAIRDGHVPPITAEVTL